MESVANHQRVLLLYMTDSLPDHVVQITHLRDTLGIACQKVATTEEPIIVQRYKEQDVAIVPLWEWRFLKRIEAAIRDGRLPWTAALAEIMEEGEE